MSTRDGRSSFLNIVFPFEAHEAFRWVLMALTFFCIVAAYTIAKELKEVVFISIVGGKEYIPFAKFLSMLLLVPLLIFYSRLVDGLRRYRLLIFYCTLYGLLGFCFSFLLGHPTIGMPNTNSSPWRLFGWIFYLFVEGYSPFVVSVFWSFANSITSPEGAKKGYGFMVSGSKLGGVVAAAFAWLFLQYTAQSTPWAMNDVLKHQILLGSSSLVLLLAPVCILFLIKRVSGRYLHGYEAVYQAEKGKKEEEKHDTGIFSGLFLLLRVPYLFGIFLIGMCYELIYQVLSYQRLDVAQQNAVTRADQTISLFEMIFWTQLAGFFISLFGTAFFMRHLGEKFCLLMVPLVTLVLFLFYQFTGSVFAFKIFFVVLRAVHYGFSYPVRESLYIPTTKDLKFKSKAWIDAFGTKLSKFNGQMFNQFTASLSIGAASIAQTGFFSIILGVWFLTSLLLGRRYEQAVKKREVIGVD